MADKRWLPVNYALYNGDKLRNLYVSGRDWQLYVTANAGYAMAVSDGLYERWLDGDWIEPGIFEEAEPGCRVWAARPEALISSVEYGPYPARREQAEAFAQTLRRSRDRAGRMGFGDALYIAQFSMLMPTFTDAAQVDDALLLGRWITGGINVSVADTTRVRRYAPWLTEGALNRILDLFGLTADAGASGIIDALPAPADGSKALARPAGRRAEGPFRLPGRPALERFFREEVIDIIDREAEYRRMGIDFPGPALLYGPPGCGKTYAIEQLTAYLGWPVYTITSGSIGSKYVHETSRRISEVFDQAIEAAPSVIVIDELEAFLSARENARSSGEVHMEEVAEFLRRIPDASKHRVLLFGMTNMPEAIDRAVLRRGRFDHQIEVGMPSRDEIRALLESLLAPLPTEAGLSLEDAVGRLAGAPISDVAFAVREAGRLTVRAGQSEITAEALKRACERATGNRASKKTLGFH